MTKQVSTAVLAIIVSLFPIGNSISPPVAIAQTPPQVECLESSATRNSAEAPAKTPPRGGKQGLEEATEFLTSEIIRDEGKERRDYTQKFVKQLSEKFPDHNIVISHKGGQVKTGEHVTHKHCELSVPFGKTVGYEIHLSPKGKPFTFVKNGDVDLEDWAYNGDFEVNGNTLTAK